MSKRLDKDEISHFIDNDLYVLTRTIYIGPVDSEDYDVNAKMAERAIKNIHILDSKANAPIEILMQNYGGEVTAGMAIYDAIKLCRSQVTIKVFGTASSMGSVILQAADHRLLAPNAKVMIHMGETAHASNHPRNIERQLEQNKLFDKWMIELYLEKMKEKNPELKYKKVEELVTFDKFYSAEEAVAVGLADGIIETHLDK